MKSSTRRSILALALTSPIIPWRLWASTSQKTIDKRHASEIGEYAIGFAARQDSSDYDHAFIVWYYSDPAGNRTVRRAAGFYPVSGDNTKAYDVVFGITGQVMNDSKEKIAEELTVLVNSDIFDTALAVENAYKNDHTYRLAFDDCTTFVSEVASTIPKLVVPSRLTNLYPSSFIKSLYASNN